MSDHFEDDKPALAYCCVCGCPITDEEDMHIVKDFSEEGDAVFCDDHYDRITTGGPDD